MDLSLIFLLKDLASTCNEALQTNDSEKLESISVKYNTVRKFILYYSRLLSMYESGTDKFKLELNLIRHFHSIHSAYNVMARDAVQSKQKYSNASLELLAEITDLVLDSLQLCLKFDQKKALSLISKREQLWFKLNKVELGKHDLLLVNAFGPLLGATVWILGEMFGLDLIKKKK